jgi:DNA polymerase-3 subunit delta'
MLDTIKSRCGIHKLKPLSNEEMILFLKNRYTGIDDKKLLVATSFAKGIPGKAERLIENEDFALIRSRIFELIYNIKDKDYETSLTYEKFFNDYDSMEEEILDIIITIIRDIIIYKEVGDEELLINIDRISDIKDLVNIFSLSKLNGIIKIVDETRKILKNNVNSSLAFITMVLRMQEV